MPSLQALPSELIKYIVDILVEDDITSAYRLLRTCKALYFSREYNTVRYLYTWFKSGFPPRKRLPRDPRDEADLLQSERWPLPLRGLGGVLDDIKCQHRWRQVPTSVSKAECKIGLSRKARLIGDSIYDVAEDGLSLHAFDISRQSNIDRIDEHQPEANFSLSLSAKVLSYDVDLDEKVIVLLMSNTNGLFLSLRSLDHPNKTLAESTLSNLQPSADISEVIVNGSSILISLGNHLHVWKWKGDEGLRRIWSRSQTSVETTNQATGWYARGSLLSSDVVACVLLYTYRTIGSMRVSQGVMELYRLDQFNPKVADITLSEISVDALQPRYLQDPYSYISVDAGGKTALTEYQKRKVDHPMIIQTFGETRVGSISSLADVLYPKAALALYSEAHPILGREWLRAYFPLLSNVSPLQSSLHGARLISCSKRGKNELTYWNINLDQSSSAKAEAATEDMNEIVARLRTSDDDVFHIDLVSIDGPRVLFTCFRCTQQHNGTIYASEPLASFWTDLQPRNKLDG